MNIVKGVADLIRRTSGGQSEEYASPGSQSQTLPTPKICFSEIGDEAVLKTLWDKYEQVTDKVDKRRAFLVFLKQFVAVYKNWEPGSYEQLQESASTSLISADNFDEIIIGCFAGHPSEIILTLTDEVKQVTALVTELNASTSSPTTDFCSPSTSMSITSEGFPVLDALMIVTQSLHNCRVFGYYGGIQKLIALMKGCVVQLKAISSAISADEDLSSFTVEKTLLLQQILVYVVSIIFSFIDLNSNVYESVECNSILKGFFSEDGASLFDTSYGSLKVPTETKINWHRKAVVSLMEAGGLNWLVELLRVIKRLSLRQQWIELSLHCMTLRILHSALLENSRGQNHFKSIGGLDVLLDGLGVPLNSNQNLKKSTWATENREEITLLEIFRVHVLSVEVLREAVFTNIGNLQFLCENGRVQKFANSFCSPAFVLQEYKLKALESSENSDHPMHLSDFEQVNQQTYQMPAHSSLCGSGPNLQCWGDYVANLSRVLCSFLLPLEVIRSQHVQLHAGRASLPVTSLYGELSAKWVMRVLLSVFPCLKASSNQNEFPIHSRIFISTLQHCVLAALRNVLVSFPSYLDIFRAEGIWELIFSESFLYFRPAEDLLSLVSGHCESPADSDTTSLKYKMKAYGVEALRKEVISFVEFAATSSGSAHNVPELSAMLDALEQSACDPEISVLLGKSLLRILQLSSEKTIASFISLNAATRVLKFACIRAQELKSIGTISPSDEVNVSQMSTYSLQKSHLHETQSCVQSVELCMQLFMEFFSAAEETKNSLLHSSACIDHLFELFWVEGLRNNVLKYIHELMKIVPLSEEDKKAKLQLCSKYLETFTQIREHERGFAELCIDLLVGMRDMLLIDPMYYQALFRDGECFLHVVSLLNGNIEKAGGEKLVLNVFQTLTCLLASNDASKAAFRSLTGKGYQALQSLLLDFCQWHPSEGLLSVLLDMLVDGKFDVKASPLIKNEDAIILYLTVLRKSSESLQHHGLDAFQQLLKDSISNRASCVRAGMLDFLLEWFPEGSDSVVIKITQLIQVIGGHSISGKDIRKIFALLRSEQVLSQQKYCSLLLSSVLSMLNEKGPTGFFDFSANDSGIVVKTPVQWPLNKGFSFSCWFRVENFPRNGIMGLFSFQTENGRGSLAVLARDKLIYESINLKRQCVQLPINVAKKKWHFLCVTHSIGRAFSGGSLLKCFVDGELISSEKCRYAKINEPLTNCKIGASTSMPLYEDNISLESMKDSSPFCGQIGPVYLFNDAISHDQVQGIYNLGPNYMYSFLDNEAVPSNDNLVPSGILSSKDGLSSKIVFGINAQASDGRILFNVSPALDHVPDRNLFEGTVMVGTQICSRSLLRQIIYCVGGVSVFFPLIAQSDRYNNGGGSQSDSSSLVPTTEERVTAEVIEIIASVLDDNLANQHQMHILSGFLILGFLLQSVPPQQLNLQTLSALKHLFNVIASCGLSELLVKDAISSIFLNPFVWLYTSYRVQRELYMFLIQQFDNDPRLLKSLCQLPRVLDITRQFYWGNENSRPVIGNKPLLHPVTGKVIGERPRNEEIHKIRLLLLSLGEMSLRQNISATDINALVAFFETSEDMPCIEDVLHMVIRAVSQKPLLSSFLEQVDSLGGCHIFINLLQRDFEPIRLLGLQFLGRLLVGLPSERKGPRFFNLAVGRSRSLSEGHKKISSRLLPIFAAMADRLFKFPQTENLCATLFDVLLGGASPKQVLQKLNQDSRQRNKGHASQFFLPQILVLIFRFLFGSEDVCIRIKILRDLVDLLDSSPSNIEAFMEFGWSSWLSASIQLDVIRNYKSNLLGQDTDKKNELSFIRNLFCIVLCYYMHSVKGGWQQIEDTVNFLLMQFEQDNICHHFLRDIYADVIQRLVDLCVEENIFLSQPCRDNTLYLLKLVDEMLISEIDHDLLFPASSSEFSLDTLEIECRKDYDPALFEGLKGEFEDQISRNPCSSNQQMTNEDDKYDDNWWSLYDNLLIVVSEMNGKGPSRISTRSPHLAGPSFGQRARGLVESLNIPAAEVAAVVVSGGIGSALGGKQNKNVDKAMLLRGERCPRTVFRLVVLYLCKSSLQRAAQCVQQFISLLPCFISAEDEQSKNRLQLFIWDLLAVRSKYGMLNEGARFHVISHLIRETVKCGKSVLASSILERDDSDSGGNLKDSGSIQNLIQKDRLLAAVSDEGKYVKILKTDRTKQLSDLSTRMEENMSAESQNRKAFEDDLRNIISSILVSDDSRRDAFQLKHEEEQQNIIEKWIHMFRALIDERGPWSSNPSQDGTFRHWKLDKTEDMWRRRLKLRQNYHFDEKLCHPPSSELKHNAAESKSGLAGQIPEQMKQFLLKGVRRITDEVFPESNELDTELSKEITLIPKEELLKDSGEWVQGRQDSISSSVETDDSEVLISVACVLVTPKRKLAGHLAVRKNELHFFGEFLVEGTGGSSVFRNFCTSSDLDLTKNDQKQRPLKWRMYLDMYPEKDTVVNDSDTSHESVLKRKQLNSIKRHRRWNIGKIKAVHWTRYLLRYTAIEIFFNNSVSPIFFNFASQKDAKDIGTLIVATRNEYLFPKGSGRDKTGVITFADRRVALEMAETARESWRRRDITNFEYLMILNTLAGRSYNDLTQYPVFPWILADYTSEALDFNKSSTFRDLSKPIGAVDSKRFEVFEERYRSFSDPDIPSFYYGSHYSSMGIVLYYLLRLEPYTSLHRNLQGGKFDHADRLFQSVDGTYRNCLSNTSDVKELIPEFFYMPEFLTNSNSYHFGVKQDGEPISEVFLPPWAKGSPEEFIRRNREALESEYVSSNLHHWIDLVFGYKQRGKPAVEAANIFYYLTYEGAVDLDTMDDDLQRSAIEDQIANFGQTPIQIFRKKHPRRGPPIPIAHPLYFAPGSIKLTSVVSSTRYPPAVVQYIHVLDSSIIIVNQGVTLSVKMWLTTQLQSGGNFTFSGTHDPLFGIGSDTLSSRKIGSPLAENMELGAQCFTTMQTASENYLISCGNWENSFQVISLNDGRMVQSIRQHKDVVNCVAVTSDGSILATGSYDTTVMVWEVVRGKAPEKRVRTQAEQLRKDSIIVETPFHILCGHDDVITCLFVSVELDIVISGSKDGTCIFHTLREGRYVRSLRQPNGCALSKLAVSQHGRIVFYADDDLSLHLYSINGKHLASSESNGRLNCLQLSKCGEFLVCAGDQGQIVVCSMDSLEVIHKYSGIGKVITSLTVTSEECFLAGTKDGSLLVYSIENPQLRKSSASRSSKSKYSAPG